MNINDNDQLAFAARQFGLNGHLLQNRLSNGLIHQTYHICSEHDRIGFVLQRINNSVFQSPQKIIDNYLIVYNYLTVVAKSALKIPKPLTTTNGNWLWKDDEGFFWRANSFVENSYTESLPTTPEKAFAAAFSFAELTKALVALDGQLLEEVLPDFHNLSFRFSQFKNAITTAADDRRRHSKDVINELLARIHYVDFFNSMVGDSRFKKRIMHHDCKLSNVLFHTQTTKAICPVDLDTLMSGYFFSDVGDMIRSMVPSIEESARNISDLTIQPDIYKAIILGYSEGMGNSFTEEEHEAIHTSGLLMTYMQALRFLTDYLLNDVYYKTSYNEQNFDRAVNQFTLLKKLEEFVKNQPTKIIYNHN